MPKFFKGSDFQGLNAPSFFCFNFAGAGATEVCDAFAICVFVCVCVFVCFVCLYTRYIGDLTNYMCSVAALTFSLCLYVRVFFVFVCLCVCV
jgi:hypothetical protein